MTITTLTQPAVQHEWTTLQADEWLELCGRAVLCDESAAREIIHQLAGHIRLACRGRRGADFDDAAAECIFELWQQVIPEFATGTVYGSFPAIAITAFRRRLMTLDRDAHRIKRGGNATTSAIIDFEHGSDRDDPARIIEENEDARIMLERILQIASPLARKAIPLLLGGYSAAECDAVLGVSPRSTGQSLRILKKTLNLESECIDQLAQNGTVVGRFDTAADAARVTGISERGIGKVLRGEMKHCGEFAWRRGLIRRECRPIDAIAAAEGDAIRHRFVSAITPKMKRQISRK